MQLPFQENPARLGPRFALAKVAYWLLGAMACLIVQRLLFVLAFHDGEAAAGALALQFLYGLRFDFATLPVLTLPALLLLPLYAFEGLPRWTVRMLRGIELLQWTWFGLANLLLGASAYNYAFNAKHLGWEFFAYLEDGPRLIHSAWSENPLLVLTAGLIFAAFIAWGYRLLLVELRLPVATPRRASKKQRALHAGAMFAGLALFTLLALRGGPQDGILRPGDAMRYRNAYLNNVALNGLFTISRDLADRDAFVRFYPEDENVRFVRKLLDEPAAFISDDYPLLRYMPPRIPPGAARPPRTPAEQPNIVLIVMESFTAKFLKEHGGHPEIAPNMQRLIDDGLYFERFVAAGGRSANGLFSIVTGMPDRAGRTILRSNQIMNRWGGIGSLLHARGYDTLWLRGADLKFDNTDNAFPHLGFRRNIGHQELNELRPDGPFVPAWGHHDESLFAVAIEQMDDMHAGGDPFFAMLFTLSTHHPFDVPGEEWNHFDASMPEHRFLNSYRYADAQLGAFIEKLRAKPYFENTIFLVTADHAHHRNLNYWEDRHLPLVIYAPGRIRPRKVSGTASMLDLLPTILALSGGDSLYAAMGRDLTGPEGAPGFAFYSGGSGASVIGWVDDRFQLMHWTNTGARVLLRAREPIVGTEDLFPEHPVRGEELFERARHFQQFARYLEQENRIWPAPAEQQALERRLRGLASP